MAENEPFAAIQGVAQDRVAGFGEVDAELVGAACVRVQVE